MEIRAVVLLVAMTVTLCSSAAVKNHWLGYKLYRLQVSTQEQLEFLRALDQEIEYKDLQDKVDIWTHLSQAVLDLKMPINVIISPEKQPEVLALLEEQGIAYKVSIDDVAAAVEAESFMSPADQKAADAGKMSWTAYHRYATMEAFVQSLAQDYSDIVELKMIGKSYEGRSMYRLKVGKPRADGKKKPAIWMDSHIHAREWIASATLLYMTNKLVTEYSRNSTVRRMVDDLDWYILPVVNPDGLEHTHSDSSYSTRMWRRTRRISPFAECLGADPNRNYDFKWMLSGAVQSPPCSDINAGAFPFSEVENLHLTDTALEVKDQLKVFLTIHSAAQMILTPWGYALEYPSDIADLEALGRRMANAITAQYGVRYQVGSSTYLLGAAAGATDDWGKAKAGVKYSYTVELRDLGYGFILPPSHIVPSGIETFEAIIEAHRTVVAEFGTTLN
ncbi:carboxypeptidase B-like [Paramacrobiotus metropolitanus]|uniref:carboxypeptidase B-like n=1 Tax=Paramacrobiotus metropolitanus TaxID=2943436 RepID=UPI0024461841|nr:carboxypeptidase B-like [Paramacrobiotus metropolitanus]